MSRWLSIVGLGEGGWSELSALGRSLVEGAELVVGGERHLAMLPPSVPGRPLGWADRQNWPQGQGWPLYWDWLSKVMGLLVTAGAASLGAPFWFDMLSKVVSVRSAGEKPKSSG